MNNSYAPDCQSVFITTCCDHMDEESNNDYTAYCDGSSLDTVIELFMPGQRPGTFTSLQESDYFPECNNPEKSIIYLNDYIYTDYTFIVSIKGYEGQYGLYTIQLVCDNDEDDGKLYKSAKAMLIISAICGSLVLSFIFTGNLCQCCREPIPDWKAKIGKKVVHASDGHKEKEMENQKYINRDESADAHRRRVTGSDFNSVLVDCPPLAVGAGVRRQNV